LDVNPNSAEEPSFSTSGHKKAQKCAKKEKNNAAYFPAVGCQLKTENFFSFSLPPFCDLSRLFVAIKSLKTGN